MIVTSLRCYLNILAQLMTAEELLDAQYYIADKVGILHFSESTQYDQETDQYVQVKETSDKAQPFMIKYANDTNNLSMFPYFTTSSLPSDTITGSRDPRARYVAMRLKNEAVLMSLYSEFIANIRKDKLVIVIFMDEATVRYGAGLACEMFSQEFGQDVTFIDPQYRPYVQGRVTYVGNKERAEIVIPEIRKKMQITGFMSAVTKTNFESNMNNINEFLTAYTEIPDAIELYNLLWPDDPLPAGNYTLADVKELIIQRALSERSPDHQRVSNLSIINANYMFSR